MEKTNKNKEMNFRKEKSIIKQTSDTVDECDIIYRLLLCIGFVVVLFFRGGVVVVCGWFSYT